MTEGLVGIATAFVIFVLVLLFYKRKPNPSVAEPLNRFMLIQGFTQVDTSDQNLKPVVNALKMSPYPVYIEQAYKRMQDDTLICWISKSADGDNNSLISVIPQSFETNKWILLYLPSLKGMISSLLKKGYSAYLLPKGFYTAKKNSPNIDFDLYIQGDANIPLFKDDFINTLPQCGNIIIHSTGKIVLLERISVGNESWEQEAREILRITQTVRGFL